MRTYEEAEMYSKQNPTELVEFNQRYSSSDLWTGFLLNGEREGVFEFFNTDVLKFRDIHNSKTLHSEHLLFMPDGSVSVHYFRRWPKMHGEYKRFNEDRTVNEHYFYNSDTHIEELNYVVNETRDDVFYVTLAMYGIDKEYTFN